MDTIDTNIILEAAALVTSIAEEHDLRYVHTVTIVLNGAHGGADVTVIGFQGADVSTYNAIKVTEVVK